MLSGNHAIAFFSATTAVLWAVSASAQRGVNISRLPGPRDDEALTVALPASPRSRDLGIARVPLSFVPNNGQVDAATKFEVRTPGCLIWLEQTEAVLMLAVGMADAEREGTSGTAFPWWPWDDGTAGLRSGGASQPNPAEIGRGPTTIRTPTPEFRLLRMQLVGAYPNAAITGEDPLPGKFHFFLGKDPSRWRTNVPSFAKVRYREVYPGVDLVYYGNDGQLEYDFVVAPGAEPSRIRLAIQGADQADVTENGDLRLVVAGRELRWRAPVLFQEADGGRVRVPGEYVLDPVAVSGDSPLVHHVTFRVARYDRTLALVIDPILAFSTYLGGGLSDHATDVAVDSDGCAHLTGGTWSQRNFPTTPNALRRSFQANGAAFVTKFHASGTQLVYSTLLTGDEDFFGGSGGVAIAVDRQGRAVVVGQTSSPDFPTANPIQGQLAGDSDVFLAKLAADGSSLVYSSFLGGSNYDRVTALALDALDNVYIAGGTRSVDFPLKNPVQPELTSEEGNPFVTRIAADGTTLNYSTYLSSIDQADRVAGLAVDTSRRAHLAWTTSKSTSPDTWESDVTVVRLSPEGSSVELTRSGFLRRPNPPGPPSASIQLSVRALALDGSGAIYLAGETSAPDLLTTPQAFQGTFAGGYSDAFVAKLRGEAMALEYLTYVGGAQGSELPSAITVDAVENACVVGFTESPDFPTADPIQAKLDGGLTPRQPKDGFVLKLSPNGSRLVWSTFLGGGRGGSNGFGFDEATGIALAPDGGALVVGRTSSSDFPIQHPFQRSLKTEANWLAVDAFLVKILDSPASPAVVRLLRTGPQVTLSWPVATAGFSLESAVDLGNPPGWAPVGSFPKVIGDQNVVTLEIGSGPRFFRLRKP